MTHRAMVYRIPALPAVLGAEPTATDPEWAVDRRAPPRGRWALRGVHGWSAATSHRSLHRGASPTVPLTAARVVGYTKVLKCYDSGPIGLIIIVSSEHFQHPNAYQRTALVRDRLHHVQKRR